MTRRFAARAGDSPPPVRPLISTTPWARLRARHASFPDAYCWYVLVCSLDLMLTNFAMNHAGAIEANGLAASAIELAGFHGLIALKLETMVVVISVCELVAIRRRATAVRLAEWAVAISAFPVVLTLVQLAAHAVRLHA